MSYNFLPYNQSQMLLLPPSLNEWLAEGHFARFLNDVVDRFDRENRLATFYASYREDGWGAPAYPPRMLVKVLLYAYAEGITSSRKIARFLEEGIAFRYLAANLRPDFRTLSDFRKKNLEALDGLFTEIFRLCQGAGLTQMGTVALDGKHVKANASFQRNRKKDAIEALVKRLLDEAEQVDAAEDQAFGAESRGDEWMAEGVTPDEQLKRFEEALEHLKKREQKAREDQANKLKTVAQREEQTGKKHRGRAPLTVDERARRLLAKAQANLTDPESRILKGPKGYLQGYNAQAMVDTGSQIIVAQDVTSEENDRQLLGHMLHRCFEQAGAFPAISIQDAGYWNQVEHQRCQEECGPVELITATSKSAKQRRMLREKPPPRGRIPTSATPKERMERKLRTQRGQNLYRQRSTSVEPVFGQFTMRGLTAFCLRSLNKVRCEWSLWCSTHNLLKLWRSGYSPSAIG